MKKTKTPRFALLWLLGFMCLTNYAFAQSYQLDNSSDELRDTRKIRRLERDAKGYWKMENYSDGLPVFMRLDSLFPDDQFYTYGVGVCLLEVGLVKESLAKLKRAEELGVKDKMLPYHYGRAAHMNHFFSDALEHYEAFKADYPRALERSEMVSRPLVDKYIDQCVVGRELIKNPIAVRVENLGSPVNGEAPEYAPVIAPDGNTMYFTARYPGSTGGEVDPIDDLPFEDIYVSTKEAGRWGIPVPLEGDVNTKSHDACVGLSHDGKKMIIYRPEPRLDGSQAGNLFLSFFEAGQWSEPVTLGASINTKGWEPSAAFSPDDKHLYFVSDRPGGYGGTDIYQAEILEDGTWGLVENLGPIINTPDNEDAPFLSLDGRTLTFASKGHHTMGGFDLFRSTIDEASGEWGVPQNLGYPINTARDDIYLTWVSGSEGYFASRRDMFLGGGNDMYRLEMLGQNARVLLKGVVVDSLTKKGIQGKVVIKDPDNGQEIVKGATKPTGIFSVGLNVKKAYQIEVSKPGYKPYVLMVYLNDMGGYGEEIVVPLHKLKGKGLEQEEELVSDAADELEVVEEEKTKNEVEAVAIAVPETPAKVDDKNEGVEEKWYAVGERGAPKPQAKEPQHGVLLKYKAHFPFNQSAITDYSKRRVLKVVALMKNNPQMRVRIIAHTDHFGTDDYNMKLSAERARSIKQFMVSNGIDPKRLEMTAKGEHHPVVQSEDVKESVWNRRVEFETIP